MPLRVVIVGGGFAGLELAKKLSADQFNVTLLDRQNYHTFQPLLYQVATGGLEPDAIAYPLRKIFQGKPSFQFRMAEVKHVDAVNQSIKTSLGEIFYDFLVIATGSKTNFFSLDPKEHHLMPMKSVPDALNLRSFILQNLEKAHDENDPNKRSELMNIAIVGGGPTGIELAGALGEMRKHV